MRSGILYGSDIEEGNILYKRGITMIRNTKKFLVFSFSILISVCILIFAITSVYISGKSDGAINELGRANN